MKILYVAPKYDYGMPERGFSFEHYNFFNCLFNMGNDIVYFDYLEIMKKLGKSKMNKLLLDVFQRETPDLVFVFLFEYELDMKAIRQISESGRTITLNWFADDHWRFDNYSRYWAPCFNWVVTTDFESVPKYHFSGYKNVILSQWACNHFLYKNMEKEPVYDVSFVGQAYGNRRTVVEALRKSGVNVFTRGHGWELGRVDQDEMIHIFNTSKININLANASVRYAGGWLGSVDRYALYTRGVKRIWRHLRTRLSSKEEPVMQIKGRTFEIPGCGGFLLTDYVNGLENYYIPGKDIVCYKSNDEMINNIKYYLANDEIRKTIAQQGWRTTLDRHTYVHRFTEVFEKIGLEHTFSLNAKPGSSVEVSSNL